MIRIVLENAGFTTLQKAGNPIFIWTPKVQKHYPLVIQHSYGNHQGYIWLSKGEPSISGPSNMLQIQHTYMYVFMCIYIYIYICMYIHLHLGLTFPEASEYTWPYKS